MNTPEEPTVLRDGYDYIWDESKLTWKVIKSTPPPEESTLREEVALAIFGGHVLPKNWETDSRLPRVIALILERERLARIDEMKLLKSFDDKAFKKDKVVVAFVYVDDRIKALSKQAVKVKAVKT